MYNIDDKIGRQPNVDAIKTYSLLTTSGTPALVPYGLGRRDYIRILNTSGTAVKLFSGATLSGTEGISLSATTGIFEEFTSAPIYIQSTGANATVIVYEKKEKRK